MDKNVNQMIAKDTKAAEIVIQGESETWHRPVKGVGIVAIRKKGTLDLFPGNLSHMKAWVVYDIRLIIKMP